MSENTEFFDELLTDLMSRFKNATRSSYTGSPDSDDLYKIRLEYDGSLDTSDVDQFLQSQGLNVRSQLTYTDDTYRVEVVR